MSGNNTNASILAPYVEPLTETTTITKVGRTYYEVTSHFDTEGKETVLQQFMELLKSEKII